MKRIIVAEDDASIQDSVKLILEGAGYDVTIYHDGDALVDGHFETPDLFLLDKLLPGIDGLDICRHLKAQERTRNIPVIVFSASPHIQNQAREAGAEDALQKPFKMEAMLSVVMRYLK